MDLAYTDDQRALRDLAREIFAGHCTQERLKMADGFDRALWAELARADVLGIAVPAEHGGGGMTFFEACIVAEEQGRAVAPIPLWPVLTAALAIARFGSDVQRARLLPGIARGETLVVPALEEPVGTTIPAVPFAQHATALLVPGSDGSLSLVEPGPGVTIAPQATSAGEPWAEVRIEGARGERLGDGGAAVWLRERATVALCAIQVGLAEQALRITADYTSSREQFGRPLGSFQAVQQRAADAYIDTEAIRLCTWQAAWRLSEELPASEEVAIAKWWAADAGQRVVAAAQHLHGGIGVDVDYPLWRYTVWSKHCELLLGGASAQLARLGELIA